MLIRNVRIKAFWYTNGIAFMKKKRKFINKLSFKMFNVPLFDNIMIFELMYIFVD